MDVPGPEASDPEVVLSMPEQDAGPVKLRGCFKLVIWSYLIHVFDIKQG